MSPWPIICFILVIGSLLLCNTVKERRIGVYAILLLSQIAFMFLIHPKVMLNEGIEATGRYALGLYTISLLYYAERGKKYAKILALLLIASAIAYFFQRALMPKEAYYITMSSIYSPYV